MNYDKIICELLARIKELEERVDSLENMETHDKDKDYNEVGKVTLQYLAKIYINEQLDKAKEEGKDSIILVCNDIQKALNVQNRAPSICNAMYEVMDITLGDTVIKAPPKGKSTTVTIKYVIRGNLR